MSMVMVNCPQTGRAIPTVIKSDRESLRRSPVFFGRTHCPICQVDHAWFAQEAWVDEPNAWARRRSAESAWAALPSNWAVARLGGVEHP